MTTITIGLNSAGGNNRIRFETLSERLQKVNIDILHSTTHVGALQTSAGDPDAGELGCFFNDELEQCKKMETSRYFRKFYFEMNNLVKSLPELIHHQNRVVELLCKQISTVVVQDLPAYFRLVAVLCRDLKNDLQPHFHGLMQTLREVVNKVAYSSLTVGGPVSANPELTGLLFECISHLLKSQWDILSQDPDCLRQYYGPLLGNPTAFVRDFAAKSFVLVVRKCGSKVFRTHMKKVIFALANNAKSYLAVEGWNSNVLLCDPLESTVDERAAMQSKSLTHKDKRVTELFEGVSLMMYYTAKGVKGRLHSKAIERLRTLWALMFPLTCTVMEDISKEMTKRGRQEDGESSKKKKGKATDNGLPTLRYTDLSETARSALSAMDKVEVEWKVYACGRVISFTVWKLFRHITPAHLTELWPLLLEMTGDVVRALRVAQSVQDLPAGILSNIHLTMSYLVEILYFGVHHSSGRGVSHKAVQQSIGDDIITAALNITELLLTERSSCPDNLVRRVRSLFCEVWGRYPQHPVLAQRVDRILKAALPARTPEPAVAVFAQQLLPVLPYGVVQRHLLQPILSVIAQLSATGASEGMEWLGTLLEVLTRIHDPREDFAAFASQCGTPAYEGDSRSGHAALEQATKDDDSWNASGSDGSDSDAPSQGSDDSVDGSTSSGDEDDGNPERQPYAVVSKNALSALMQNSSSITSLAQVCLKTVGAAVAPNAGASQREGKKGKKGGVVVVPASSSASAVTLLAAKCAHWFVQCVPQVVLNNPDVRTVLIEACSTVLKAVERGANCDLATSIGFPLFSELLALSARVVDLDAAFAKTVDVMSALRGALMLLQANPFSVALSWAIQTVLSTLSARVLELGSCVAGTSNAFVLTRLLSTAEQDALLEVMASALASPSYWVRLNWLRILAHLPPAQLAEAEVDVATKKAAQNQPSEVDVARLCLEAMCLSPDIRHEREYARRVGVLEVHLRGGRMSPSYMRVVCGFCLGLLHFKFKPIWEPAVLVLVSAAKLSEGEATMWPLLLKAIESTIEPKSDVITSQEVFVADDRTVASSVVSRKPLVEQVATLSSADDGKQQVPTELVQSELFPYQSAHSTKQLVEPDARTDSETVCSTVWNILKRSPNVTLKRSKIVVGIFISFLSKQYYCGFAEDPEVPYLRQLGLFNLPESMSDTHSSTTNVVFPTKILKKRLEMFLQVFAAVTSPKQLYCHQILYAFYHEIMAKADVNAVKLAFDCIVTYKPSSIVPYKDNVKRLLEDKTIRDELVNLDLSSTVTDSDAQPAIKAEHRPEVVPLLVKTVYGRFTSKARGSKAARDTNIARRAAVLVFISKLDPAEMRHLLQLMLRGIVPAAKQKLRTQSSASATAPATFTPAEWYDGIDRAVQTMSAAELDGIAWERQIGFLHLLQPIIRILGFGITAYIPLLHQVILTMLNHAQDIRRRSSEASAVEVSGDYDDDEDEEQKAIAQQQGRDEAQALRVRSLCLLRIAEMIDQYHAVHNFMTNSDAFFTPLQPLILALPSAISSCRANCPAILRIFHSLSQYAQTISVLAEREEIVRTVIRCVASQQAFHEVMKYVVGILHALLDWEGGRAVFPHSELIIASFSKRFVGPAYEETVELKLSEMNITPTGSIKTELKLLCRIASGVFQRTDISINPVLVTNLAVLLLGMLRTYTTSRRIRVEEDWVIDILKIYQTLLFRIPDVTNQVAFLARLFGPTAHSFSLFNVITVRSQLVQVLGALSEHPSTLGLLRPAHRALVEITSEDPTLIGSRDFGRFMPVLQALSQEGRVPKGDSAAGDLTWSAILGPELPQRIAQATQTPAKVSKKAKVPASNLLAEKTGPRNVALYSAPLHEIIRCMYDGELVVRSAALAALKRLVSDVAGWSGCSSTTSASSAADAVWLDLLRSTVVPAVRRGLRQSTDIVKKGFVLLFAHVVRTIGMSALGKDDEMFHADASFLLHDDPEQDFFENIVHIQLHRRVRALAKLRALLVASGGSTRDSALGDVVMPLTAGTFNHVLLPVAYHFLFSDEFQKKDHQPLMQEAAAFVGSISGHLKWNHYLATIKTVLRQLERAPAEKEKVLITTLCAVLDAFHFNLSGTRAAALSALPDRQGVIDMMALPEKRRKGGKAGSAAAVTAPAAVEGDKDSDIEAEPGDDGVEPREDEDEPAAEEDGGDEEVEGGDSDDAEVTAAEVLDTVPDPNEDLSYVTIAQTLVNSILPWVQVFLLKSGKDHKGNATKTVQPQVALAVTKLIQRLEEPVVTAQYKHNLFVNLVIRVISTLKSQDTSGRDVARDCLAKMITTLGLASLKPVLYELQFALKEGFQRHVCNYTVRTILRIVLADYAPPSSAPSVPLHMLDKLSEIKLEPVIPAFDTAIPLVMQSVIDDLAGGAQDDREADEALRSLIREAKGSKANDTLELTAKSLLFRPTYALLALEDPASLSSIHALTIPLLNTLQQQSYDKSNNALVGRVAEALQRVALGLSKNPTLEAKELLLYLHSTLQPFVAAITRDLARHREAMGRIAATGFKRKQSEQADDDADALDNDVLDEALPSYLREESSDEDERALYSNKQARGGRGDDVTGYRASTWLPSDRRSLQEQRAVIEARNREARARIEVQDGASAPRLTGRNKYTKGSTAKTGFNAAGGTGGDRCTLVAIKYCLTLLYSCLKQNKLDSRSADVQAMAVPFLPLLGKCLQLPAASSVVALAVRCMTTLIGWGIPVDGKFLTALGNRLMKLIFKGGGLVSAETELAQACTKGLSALFKIYNSKTADFEAAKDAKKRTSLGSSTANSAGKAEESVDPLKPVMPIGADNLRSLVQLLTVSVMEITSTFQTAAFQLVREIVATRVLIPEIYDLVTKLAEQIVLSQRKGVRESASSIVVTFLVSYPLGEKRVASQLKQLINNCEFEFEEGRAAALRALVMLIKALPAPVLEDYAQMLFLPSTLRVVNDKSARCREQAAAVIVALVRKVSPETVAQFQEYALKWLTQAMSKDSGKAAVLDTQGKSLVRTGSQIAGLVVKGRPDLCKRDNHLSKLVQAVQYHLQALLEHTTGQNLSKQGGEENGEQARFEEGQGELGRADSCWGIIYHLVGLCEQLYLNLPAAADHAITHIGATVSTVPIMELLQESLLFPHAWVRAASVRVLVLYLKRRDVSKGRLNTSTDGVEVLTKPNGLYNLARRLCVVLNQTSMSSSMLESTVTCTVFAVRALLRNPELNQVSADVIARHSRSRKRNAPKGDREDQDQGSSASDSDGEGDSDNGSDEDDEDSQDDEFGDIGEDGGEEAARAGLDRAIDDEHEPESADESAEEDGGSDAEQPTGSKRKAARAATDAAQVKRLTATNEASAASVVDGGDIDAATVGTGGAHWVMQRLRGIGADSRGARRVHALKVLLALVQAESAQFVTAYLDTIIEVAVRGTLAVNTTPDDKASPVQVAKELSAELLERLEHTVGSSAFIGAYSTAQRRIQSSKAEKKRQLAAEAITEPQKHAARKIERSQQKKASKKRQTLRNSAIRGLSRKSGKGPAVY